MTAVFVEPAKKRRRFFNRTSWPLAVVGLVAILRGVAYFGTVTRPGHQPAGLDAIGGTPTLFAFYCTLWMVAGCLAITASITGRRRIALSLLVGLCLLWSLGYLAQFLVDVFINHNVMPPLVYLGGLSYLGFGAALFPYPAKG